MYLNLNTKSKEYFNNTTEYANANLTLMANVAKFYAYKISNY